MEQLVKYGLDQVKHKLYNILLQVPKVDRILDIVCNLNLIGVL